MYENWYPFCETVFRVNGSIQSVLTWTFYFKTIFTNTRYEKSVLQFGPFHNGYTIYDNMTSIPKSKMATELSDIVPIYQER